MDLGLIGGNFLAFIFVLSVLVFIHEYGHFWVARRNDVRVQTFSIGFGSELFGWTDRHGTRWRVAALPFGGYVKFLGDMNPASQMDPDVLAQIPEQERAETFAFKSLGVRAAVVFAGPAANFLLAWLLIFGLFIFYGQQRPQDVVLPTVEQVIVHGPAAQAGLEAGDLVLAIGGQNISTFEDLRVIVADRPGQELMFDVERAAERLSFAVTIGEHTLEDGTIIGRIGIRNSGMETVQLGILESGYQAARSVVFTTGQIFISLWEMISGQRSADEIGGPLRIAEYSGDAARAGIVALISLTALLSINLGLINLFPIPILDGGHLLMYFIEWIKGSPMGEKAQEFSFKIGLGLVLTLMIFASWNDLVRYFG